MEKWKTKLKRWGIYGLFAFITGAGGAGTWKVCQLGYEWYQGDKQSAIAEEKHIQQVIANTKEIEAVKKAQEIQNKTLADGLSKLDAKTERIEGKVDAMLSIMQGQSLRKTAVANVERY